ncbi:MAG: YHS domain-containing protein [Hyphomonadaceae bacterium]|nr:YHS domain-containing protein [Hyphomonadaceae bacterium]
MSRKLLAAFAIAFAAFAPAAPAFADERPVYTAPFSNVGVSGYDVVAYFADGTPTRGSAEFRTTHQGVEYRFASAQHLAAFQANPARYLPQYGGYCAWAVSQGYTASADPDNWRIVDGKLYLNYNTEIQRRWEQDIPGHIRNANANWPGVLSR